MSADTLNAETWRFDAYYYGFTPTGVAPVDLVLSAVATAGKAFHHTESWNDEAKFTAAPNLRGGTPVEWIQNAALDAAAALRAAEARIKALTEALWEAKHALEVIAGGDGDASEIASQTLAALSPAPEEKHDA